MDVQVFGRVRQPLLRLGSLLKETVAGALLGALGGPLFGIIFGLLRWATSGEARPVWSYGWTGLWAAAAAGGVASFADMWFGQEPMSWEELVPHRRATREGPARGSPLSAVAQEGDLIIRVTGEAMRVSATPPKRASNGQASRHPPRATPP